MPPEDEFDGRHTVRKKARVGEVEYHHAYRGGPRIWTAGDPIEAGSKKYKAAFQAAKLRSSPEPQPHPEYGYTVPEAIARYRRSKDFVKLADRTKDDYNEYLDSFELKFRTAFVRMFEDRASKAEIRTWKEQWNHSDQMHDYATTVVTRLLNWLEHEDHAIRFHFHTRQRRHYKADRSDIIWLPNEIDAVLEASGDRARRIIIVERETGLSPQDLGKLERKHVQKTPRGRRIFMRRGKTQKPISLPVSPVLGEVIDGTPPDQKTILVSLDGRPLKSERTSSIVREAKEAARALDPESVREELRLHDLRGTAATNLLRAGCALNEIAVWLGWGLRHASNVIERYAAWVPEVTDEVMAKLNAFWAAHHAKERVR